MAVGTVRDELVAESLELNLKSLGVLDNLLLVLAELRSGGLLEGDSQSSDGVVVGTTLVTREDGEVDRTLKIIHDVLAGLGVSAAHALAEEDHGTTGTTERLVGGGGNHIGVLEGRRNDTGSNQTGDVSHVDNQVGANLVGNLAHTGVVNETAVGRSTSNQALGTVELSVGLEGIVVNDAGLSVDPVGEGLKVGRNSGNPGQVNTLFDDRR